MIIDIIVAYKQRYKFGHEKDFVPPITGIHLAALTPAKHQVRVFHQQVDPINFETDADLIAISFFSGFANEAFRLVEEFRKRGKTVIAGGPHVTFSPEEALERFDSIVIGEAESVWAEVLADFESGKLKNQYYGQTIEMDGFPQPRYDLLSDRFFIKKVIQATRGCPYSCSFCTVPIINPGFRKRPIDEVIRDVSYDGFKYFWQRKVVWFWDDNLTIDRKYIKGLLREMTPLKKWWLTQASVDIARDKELLDLMRDSGCIGVFLGLESFGENSIEEAGKKQNRVAEYRAAIEKLHARGISVMAGLISGFDSDTPESVVQMADDLMNIGVDVPFLSVMTPFVGTAVYDKFRDEGRLLQDRDWDYYNGYNVTFRPANMTPEELFTAHRELWGRAFSFKNSLKRIARGAFRLSLGAFMLSLFMNGFYGYKRLRGNYPRDAADGKTYREHEEPSLTADSYNV